MPATLTRIAALLAASIAALSLSGCGATPADTADRNETEAHRAVADFVRSLYRGPTDTVDDYARWADEKLMGSPSLEMIGYQAYPDAVHGEPFGALQLRATIATGDSVPQRTCYEAEFDFWGVATEEFGRWDDDDAVARPIECPADARAVDPPVDTRPVSVVPPGAKDIVTDVLRAADPDSTEESIRVEMESRMPKPTGDREVAFEPSVVIRDQEIGVAMGDVDDCLLVVRRTDGAIEVLQVPRVLLQPGELGCRADTALLLPDRLRSPH